MDSITKWSSRPGLTLKGTRGNRAPHCVPSTGEYAPLARVAVLNQRTTTQPHPSADRRFRDSHREGEQLDACSVVGSGDRGAQGSAGVSVQCTEYSIVSSPSHLHARLYSGMCALHHNIAM